MAPMFFLIAIIVAKIGFSNIYRWPDISPRHWNIHINTSDSNSGITDYIYDKTGKKIYSISCHSQKYVEKDFDFSGIMQCYVLPFKNLSTVTNLLTETYSEHTDWENRSRFLQNHILPNCANYPEWGSHRNFLLRGMKISISIENVSISEKRKSTAPLVKEFDLIVDVKNSPGAHRAIAEHTSVRMPHWFYYRISC